MRRFTESVRRYFLSGLVAFLPLAATIWILNIVVRFMDNALNFLPPPIRPKTYIQVDFPGLGALVTFLLICLIGVFVTHFVSHQARALLNSLLRRIPIVRGVYGAMEQLAHALLSQDRNRSNRVVLVEFPRKGIYALGFVTGVSEGEVQDRTGEKVVNVFVPMTPNPTSGRYVLVPEREVIALEMSVEEAFKLIASGGMVVPKRPDPKALPKQAAS